MPSDPRKIAIIPARGGSKRFPRKNIALLGNKPLIHHTIEAAIQSGIFDEVIVSTEDTEIASLASVIEGITVDIRPAHLATDTARIRDVCEEILQRDLYQNVESFCVLLATSALRTEEHIKDSHQLFVKGHDFVASVTDYFFYPHAAIVDQDGIGKHFFKEMAYAQGQDIPNFKVENGAINWCNKQAFLKQREFFGNNTALYYMDRRFSIDIDTPEDFWLMQAVYEKLNKNEEQ
ncbi:cytidylyltransferase domain-containing protein [Curvivirga sp.]|uniref:acylneuraminate cytidylyltransferase family protein n=1 Tax=Curvivirga sp. TaxID=2856848 RepID=UPI003B5A29B3